MGNVKSRREIYSEATRAALLEKATELFAERGYADTSLESVASASQVTRGAVYHHFASKQALFEVVLDQQESAVIEEIMATADATDPWEMAMLAIETFLDKCCDPTYGRLVWLEGPTTLGWHRWRECEEKYFLGLVEKFARILVDTGYLDPVGLDSTVRFIFWVIGGAGLALAETSDEERPRVRNEWSSLLRHALGGLRVA